MGLISRWRRSVTVDSVNVVKGFVFDEVKQGETLVLKEDACVELGGSRYVERNGKWKHYPVKITVQFKAGFKTDGASSGIFKGLVPCFIMGNDVYNAAPFTHDGLYAKEGRIDGAKFSRDECDDILRGVWRESEKLGRGVAGIADIGIGIFAGGRKHWGNDSDGCGCNFYAKLEYLDK